MANTKNTGAGSARGTDPAQLKRIADLKARLRALPGGAILGNIGKCSPDVEEQFLRSILAFEQAPTQPLIEQLALRGVRLRAPETLDDRQIGPALAQLARDLARNHIHLVGTEHMSDRQVYEWLWREHLPQPINLGEGLGEWFFDALSTGARARGFAHTAIRFGDLELQ